MISSELARRYRAFEYMGLGITVLAMIIAVYVAAKVGLIHLTGRRPTVTARCTSCWSSCCRC